MSKPSKTEGVIHTADEVRWRMPCGITCSCGATILGATPNIVEAGWIAHRKKVGARWAPGNGGYGPRSGLPFNPRSWA